MSVKLVDINFIHYLHLGCFFLFKVTKANWHTANGATYSSTVLCWVSKAKYSVQFGVSGCSGGDGCNRLYTMHTEQQKLSSLLCPRALIFLFHWDWIYVCRGGGVI